MRKALGLGTGSGQHTPQQRPEQARARHRFVQDGGVPVVMLNQKHDPDTTALREKITSLEGALERERQQNEQLRRQVKESSDQVTALQTRIAHNELAQRDALEQERHLREAAQEALQEAIAATPARRRMQSHPIPAELPEVTMPEPEEPKPIPAATKPERTAAELEISAMEIPPVQKRGRGRPRSTTPPEPKPVRWWTPSYRSKDRA